MAWTGLEGASQSLGTPGQDLVMVGYMALSGTDAMIRWDRPHLMARLPEEMLQEMVDLEQKVSNDPFWFAPEQMKAMGATAWYPTGMGGLFNALWYMADHWGTGFSIQLKEIPVRQETIEVCEVEEKNPYYLWSSHCYLVAADHGHRFCEAVKSMGLPAAVIGTLTDKKDKVLVHDSTVSCLNRPKEDELDQFMKEHGLGMLLQGI